MIFNNKIISSKLGRRIFLMFVFCALIPVITLTLLSFTHVTRQLNEQSYGRLKQSTKTYGMHLFERLMFLENDLRIVGSDMIRGSAARHNPGQLSKHLSDRFKGIYHYREEKGYEVILGTMNNPPRPTPGQYAHLLSGEPLLLTQPHSDILSQIFLAQLVSMQDPDLGYIMGELNPIPFWGIGHENKLPPLTELYALDQSNKMLISSIPVSAELISDKVSQAATLPNREFEFDFNGDPYIASYWTMFLRPRYLLPNWTIVLSQSKSDVFAPASEYKIVFPQVIILSLFIILLLSIIYIRKSLVPLQSLKEGTLRIAKRDFSVPVDVTSNDEFKELATSFNSMSTQLSKQFQALITRSDIDRAILSSLDKEKIIETVITRIKAFFSCDVVGFSLTEAESGKTINYFLNRRGSAIHTIALEPKQQDMEKLHKHPDYLQYKLDGNIPFYLAPVANKRVHSFLVLPLFIKGELSGIIHLGYRNELSLDTEDIRQARLFADQSAIALSNSNLVDKLHHQNLGTIEALARSVDAKSPWTAGHSERVTEMALKIGSAMNLDSEQLSILHKGGLLHDVGKIGVPAAILDKPGKLTHDEYEIIKSHPALGARILEPIKSFSELMPLVVQHHERYDGKGYPESIIGDAISLGARILSVSDAYDAMTSDRPFRKSLPHTKALNIIKEVSGTQFDPKVVKVFLEIVEPKIKREMTKPTVLEHPAAINVG